MNVSISNYYFLNNYDEIFRNKTNITTRGRIKKLGTEVIINLNCSNRHFGLCHKQIKLSNPVEELTNRSDE